MGLRLHQLHYNLGYVLHQQGRLAEAAQSYRAALALNADYVDAHHNLGVVLNTQGQFAAAIEHYRHAIRLQPNYLEAYNDLGCTLAHMGQLEAAIEIYQQAIQRAPHWAVLHNNLGQALFPRDAAAAIAAYRQAIALQPDFVTAHHNLGQALQYQNLHDAAIECFERVLQLDPDHLHAHSGCGISWLAQGKLALALPHFRAVVLRHAPLVQAYCSWAHQLTGSDQLTLARQACAQFLQALQTGKAEVYDSLAQTYIHLGDMLMRYGGKGQYQQASEHYQKALLIQPGNFSLYSRLSHCLIQQGRSNAAIVISRLALCAAPHQPESYQQLGDALEQQQKLPQAIDYYRQSLEQQRASNSLAGAGLAARQHEFEHSNQRVQTTPAIPREPALDASSGLSSIPDHLPLPAPAAPPVCATTEAWMLASQNRDRYCPLPNAVSDRPAQAYDQPTCDGQGCGGLNCPTCLQQVFRWFNPVHLGQEVHHCQPQARPTTAIPQFTANLPQGRAWAVPQQNAWMICHATAILTPDQQLLADVSRTYPGSLPTCRAIDLQQHPLLNGVALPPPEPIKGRVAALTGLSGHIYFHWMVDVLPRIGILQQSGIALESIDWFWINSSHLPFQQTTLEILGIPPEKVLSSDRHPYIQADELIVPSFPSHLGWVEDESLRFLRQMFLPRVPATQTALPRRIYVSRSNASHRRVLNEAAVIEQLQAYGFVTVELESMPFLEQVALFASAEIVVAPHGGGLTNLLFSRPGTTVIELMSPHYVRHYYCVVSQLLGLNHFFVTGEILPCSVIRQLMYPSPLTEDIWVKQESLQAALAAANII